MRSRRRWSSNFYPRSPCGERRQRYCTDTTSADFYPRSPCGERLPSVLHSFRPLQISIHALLAESDVMHALIFAHSVLFLSTLSLRRATRWVRSRRRRSSNFYPRSPCGERHGAGASRDPARDFYPRSPCGERRAKMRRWESLRLFLSTLSLRRATGQTRAAGPGCCAISIHALLAESDDDLKVPESVSKISIHALLAESDKRNHLFSRGICYFYPRSPCGERPQRSTVHERINSDFYPRSPCGERPPTVRR